MSLKLNMQEIKRLNNSAIRAMEPDAENIWAPAGGEPVIIQVKDGAY